MSKKNCLKKGCGCLLVVAMVIAIVLAVVAYLSKPKWHDEYGSRYLDVPYGSRTHNTYDLYLSTDAATRDSLALILYVHGGSWIGGDKAEHAGDCYAWVEKGYATATMNYSLLKEENTSLVTMLDEIEKCVEHIVRFAADKGAHIRQMAIGGTSAGGHLSMMFAYNHRHPLPIQFVAIKVGPADFRILFPYDANASAQDVENFVFSCTGKHISADSLSPQRVDSIKLQASPVCYINDSTALPAIFAYGGKDGLVKPDHYRTLQAAYDRLGKRYDLIVFPNSGHLLIDDKECMERYDSTLNAYCKTYFGY